MLFSLETAGTGLKETEVTWRINNIAAEKRPAHIKESTVDGAKTTHVEINLKIKAKQRH